MGYFCPILFNHFFNLKILDNLFFYVLVKNLRMSDYQNYQYNLQLNSFYGYLNFVIFLYLLLNLHEELAKHQMDILLIFWEVKYLLWHY